MLGKRRSQRGDTLIEVMFAFSVFSLTVVGAMAVMNQGAAASQRALETTLVRQQIDAQATTLRFLHDAYVAEYQAGKDYDNGTPAGQWALMTQSIQQTAAASASSFGAVTSCPTPPSGSFILNAETATFIAPNQGKLQPPSTFAQVVYDASTHAVTGAEGIWIEAIRSATSSDPDQNNTGFIDFHIRACWDGPAQGVPMTIGTIVRLYEPRG